MINKILFKTKLVAKGLNQGKLALNLNISQSAVSLWANGYIKFNQNMIAKICDLLEVAESELFQEGRENEGIKDNSANVFKKTIIRRKAKGITEGSAA